MGSETPLTTEGNPPAGKQPEKGPDWQRTQKNLTLISHLVESRYEKPQIAMIAVRSLSFI